MNEEEIMKNYNKFYKEKDGNLTITIDHSAKDEIDKAIQGILELYKAEKEKNKAYDKLLERYNKLVCCHLQYEEMTGIDLLLPDTVDVISKSKIKAKIEELEKEMDEKSENCCDFTLIHEHEIDTNGIIQVLQELLEEEIENE